MPVPIDYTNIRRMSTITVPKQDIHFDVYDFQQCKPQNNIDNTLESRQLEADYCRDFSCCGLVLNDLHDLLQHYEECHVQCEEEEIDQDDDTWSCTPPLSPTLDISSSTPSSSGSPVATLDSMKRKAASYLSDVCNQYGTMDGYDLTPVTPTTPGFNSDYSLPPTPSTEEHHPLLGNNEDNNKGEEDDDRICGKKRTFQQTSSTNAMDLLTLSAAKKLALAAGDSFNSLTDEEFLAHAGVLLASANTSYLYADKPYKCAVQGCDKAYKNPNGLKYHKEHGHCSLLEDNETPKPYQCTIGDCGKRYKNLNGLKYHIEHSHMAALNHTLATFGCSLLQTPPASAATSPLLDSSDSFI
ncbi:uncharacterized protein BX664DRAFT_28001 [Halteromyces radiatus]|uniref:uncharacterized protein n=1 Tax=Halteromyces radiatus TaxID=101107 RepID=UPI00221F80C1|nr:uncharacterized protein BX664DRAFT_28001 [Halteromyces radiatus]KAI8099797.1 hypothetical protein BX664DRAFT_28001 [Halteromyces radiatus]